MGNSTICKVKIYFAALYRRLAKKRLSSARTEDIEGLIEHTNKTSRFFGIIARTLGMEEDIINRAQNAVLLHDIGKLANNEIFALTIAPRKLTEKELMIVRQHAQKSLTMLSEEGINFIDPGLEKMILYHHDPEGLVNDPYLKNRLIWRKLTEILIVSDYISAAYDTSRAYHNGYRLKKSVLITLQELAQQWGTTIGGDIYAILGEILIDGRNPAFLTIRGSLKTILDTIGNRELTPQQIIPAQNITLFSA